VEIVPFKRHDKQEISCNNASLPKNMLTVCNLCLRGLSSPLSFNLQDGECIAVQGASGSGKSLLLRALADLDPTPGEVSLNDKPRDSIPAPQWRSQVVYLPSEPGWWSDYVADHFPDWEQALPWVTALCLPATIRSRTVQRLSTGERQRLALVRALMLQPQVLLLDEPTSGLDGGTTQTVERIVGEYLARGTSALWVTHDLEQARRVARRYLFVEKGLIREGWF
jgi:putative ABC transport system ATP-binding protein